MTTSKDGYVSEFTDFMNEFLKNHPEEITEQRKGWNIYWNKKVDFEAQEEAEKDSVPVDGYYYFGNP